MTFAAELFLAHPARLVELTSGNQRHVCLQLLQPIQSFCVLSADRDSDSTSVLENIAADRVSV